MRKRKSVEAIVFFIAIIPLFFSYFLNLSNNANVIVAIILFLLSLLSFLKIKSLFSTILFFFLVQLLKPINNFISNYLGLGFAGIYFLLPIVIFTIIILLSKSVRDQISWWKLDKIDKKSTFLIFALVITSSLALYIWSIFFKNSLYQYLKQFPEVSILWIIMNGIFFAVFNSFAEEYLSRGMLCNGLEKIIKNKIIIIIIQASIFGIFHYSGFPGGIVGVIMVFFWSLILGLIRYRTNGILGVLIAHFFSDLTIYFILYSFKLNTAIF